MRQWTRRSIQDLIAQQVKATGATVTGKLGNNYDWKPKPGDTFTVPFDNGIISTLTYRGLFPMHWYDSTWGDEVWNYPVCHVKIEAGTNQITQSIQSTVGLNPLWQGATLLGTDTNVKPVPDTDPDRWWITAPTAYVRDWMCYNITGVDTTNATKIDLLWDGQQGVKDLIGATTTEIWTNGALITGTVEFDTLCNTD